MAFATLSVCGLDYAFTILQVGDYSLYTFNISVAWLGVGILNRSPNLHLTIIPFPV